MEINKLKQFKIRWFVLYCVAVFIGVFIFFMFIPNFGANEQWITFFVTLLILLYVLYYSNKYRFTYSEQKLAETMNGPRWTKYLSLTAAIQFAATVLGYMILLYVFLIFEESIQAFFQSFLIGEELTTISPIVYFVFFLNVCILAPLSEELFFRGILLRRFMIKWSPQKSIIVSSILFGIIHFSPVTVVFAFLLGCILGYTYLKTKSIVVPMLIHSFSNFLACIQFYISNQMTSKSLLLTTEGAQQWLQISAVAFIILVIFIVFMIVKYYKNFRSFTLPYKKVELSTEE